MQRSLLALDDLALKDEHGTVDLIGTENFGLVSSFMES